MLHSRLIASLRDHRYSALASALNRIRIVTLAVDAQLCRRPPGPHDPFFLYTKQPAHAKLAALFKLIPDAVWEFVEQRFEALWTPVSRRHAFVEH